MFGAPTCSFKSERQGKKQIRPLFVGIVYTDPSLKTPTLASDWEQESCGSGQNVPEGCGRKRQR